ncbi:MAG: Kelch repeat-containing protein, partial [Solirubrobacteraceae bacterium]
MGIELLKHTRHGWSLWYHARTLARAKRPTAVAVPLARIPAGVDKIAIELVLRGSVSVRVGGFSVEYMPPPGRPVPKTVVTPSGGGGGSPSGSGASPGPSPGVSPFPIGPGSWSVITPPKLSGKEVHAVHAILLQNGKVLVMAGSGNVRSEFEGGSFSSFVYDPVANSWNYVPTPKDVFCSGHVQLANGDVLIIGGTKAYPPKAEPGHLPSTEYQGENRSWIFNIRTESYEEVKWNHGSPHQPAEPGPLLNGAWYPSATELGNGDVISFGGLKENGKGGTATNYFTGPGNAGTEGDNTEEWVGFGSKKLQQTYDWFWGLYPTMILTADGRLFYTGSHVFGKGLDNVPREKGPPTPEPNAPEGSSLYDFYCTPGKTPKEEEEESGLKAPGVMTNPNAIVRGPYGEFKRVTSTPGLRNPDNRDQSTSLLLPPAQEQKVMIMGGGETYSAETDAINLTDEINLKEPSPHWVPGPNLPQGEMEGGGMEPMGAGKMYVSAVALPDGNVLETGGSLLPRSENVHEASIFNPASNTFTPVAADPVGRNYHSEALLLPDGRVMTLGSNPANKTT